MRSINHHRPFLFVTLISIAFGLGCTKRSGLDRGDANENVIRRPNTQTSAEFEGTSPTTAGTLESKPNGFAAAPPDEAFDSAPGDAGEAVPAAPSVQSAPPSRGAGSDAVTKAAPRQSAAAESPRADLSPRGSQAYASERESYKRREERPGLGTSWGESRRSRVSGVSFERDNPNSPTATQRIFYNDADGIFAQTGVRSVATLGPNVTELGRGFVTVEIVDADGLALPGLSNGRQSYVVGRDGDRYSIRIRNNERHRVEVVATVDGLDVVDGTKGSYQKRGYVVEPYSSVLIEGFRRSTSAVASFRFGAVSESYAARTGSDRQIGVIGIALFDERGCCVEEYSKSEIDRRETADPFPGQFSRPPRPRQQYRAY